MKKLSEYNVQDLEKKELLEIDGGSFAERLGWAVGVVTASAICAVAKAAEILGPSRLMSK